MSDINSNPFYCKRCKFTAKNEKNYKRHTLSRTHMYNILKVEPCVCGKTYKHIHSLWKHRKKCQQYKDSLSDISDSDQSSDQYSDQSSQQTDEQNSEQTQPQNTELSPQNISDLLPNLNKDQEILLYKNFIMSFAKQNLLLRETIKDIVDLVKNKFNAELVIPELPDLSYKQDNTPI
jgi:hypothetical protein